MYKVLENTTSQFGYISDNDVSFVYIIVCGVPEDVTGFNKRDEIKQGEHKRVYFLVYWRNQARTGEYRSIYKSRSGMCTVFSINRAFLILFSILM